MKTSKEKLAKFLRDNLLRRKAAAKKEKDSKKNIVKGPMNQFNLWYDEAKNKLEDPSKMILATATDTGIPSARILLLKHYDESGFGFYTNLGSKKAIELLQNPNAALLFDWENHQVRIDGTVKQISDLQADQYFNSRPTDSKIVSILSRQSQILEDRAAFEKKIIEYQAKVPSASLKRPDYWSGFILKPHTIEFWTSGEARNHMRHLYKLNDGGEWLCCELYP